MKKENIEEPYFVLSEDFYILETLLAKGPNYFILFDLCSKTTYRYMILSESYNLIVYNHNYI